MTASQCLLCDVSSADSFFERRRVWEDDLWRLSVVLRGPVPGFSHLETKRHIPFITDLAGEEEATLGRVLSRCTRVVRQGTGADKVYVYVFGDRVPHLHFNLAPHHDGDALVGGEGLVSTDAVDAGRAEHHNALASIASSIEGSGWVP